jgi:S-adenosylmethionine-diacylglycerol 3-amino-3-carboxypropyl transferase
MLRRIELPGAVDDRLFFAQVREDPLLELAAFQDRLDGPIAIVSSAGCTALSLVARGATEVYGVDVNRTQHHLVEFKAAAIARHDPGRALALLGAAETAPGARLDGYRRIRDDLTPPARRYWDARPTTIARGVLQAGATERLMRLIAVCLRLIHPRRRVRELLALQTLGEQSGFYRDEWDNARWRLLFRLLCNRMVLRRTYDPRFFAHVKEPSFARHFHRVAEHTLTELAVRDNYFLHFMLTGRYPADSRPPYLTGRVPVERLTLVDGSLTDFLSRQPDRSMAGFALSNICEWLTDAEVEELFAQIVRTARPGARLVFRNFVGWTEVPGKFQEIVFEDRARGERLMRLDRSLCQRRFAICEVRP